MVFGGVAFVGGVESKTLFVRPAGAPVSTTAVRIALNTRSGAWLFRSFARHKVKTVG